MQRGLVQADVPEAATVS